VNQVRVIATNIATKSTVEAQLSLDQARRIIEQVYSEPSIVENQFEHVEAGHTLDLLANSKDLIVLSTLELVRFGFNPDDLEASQRSQDYARE